MPEIFPDNYDARTTLVSQLFTVNEQSFTRPADTTAYASGDLVANSTTAASVVPMVFPVVRKKGGMALIRAVRVRKSGTGITNAVFRLHLYKNPPATITNGDNGVWSTSGVADYIGSVDVTVDKAFTNGAFGRGVASAGEGFIVLAEGTKGNIYGILEARGAYTPANAEVITCALEVEQH